MIPFITALLAKPAMKKAGKIISSIPKEVWYGLALLVILLILRSHWIGVGVDRCEAEQAEALEKALKKSAKQEKAAPAIAQEARDAVKPKVEERIRVIREQIPAGSCSDDYPDGVQAVIREAAAAAD